MLNIAQKAARKAGHIILTALDHLPHIQIDEKSQNDYVTEIDKKSEQEIIYHIKKAYPDHSVIAEEGGGYKGDSEYTWIIDPLDGTANFMRGLPHFAISIGIMKGKFIEYGLIYDPVRDEIFSAKRGGGAQLNNHRIRVNSNARIENALLTTGLPFRSKHLMDSYMASFNKLRESVSDIRRLGSAALDLAYVACGRLDGYWEFDLQSWDIAAGSLIVKEAGGYVTDFEGKDDYLKSGNILAASPKIYPHIFKALQG